MPDSEPIIVFDSVSKKYDKHTFALINVNFKVYPGEFVFILGPSGAGKTTILNLLTAHIKPSSGIILVDGIELKNLSFAKVLEVRRKFGVVHQDFKLLNSYNVIENIIITLKILKRPKSSLVESSIRALSLVGLLDRINSYPEELSGGEKQRVAIARAIASSPKILLADEPTGNLDEDNSKIVIDMLQAINATGTTVIVATHNTKLTTKFHYRAIHLHKGTVIS